MQLGEKEFKERREQEVQDEMKEQEMEQKIRELKKIHQNKGRRGQPKGQPNRKKQRKNSEGDESMIVTNMQKSESEKRKRESEENQPPKKKSRQIKMSEYIKIKVIEVAPQSDSKETPKQLVEVASPTPESVRPHIEDLENERVTECDRSLIEVV